MDECADTYVGTEENANGNQEHVGYSFYSIHVTLVMGFSKVNVPTTICLRKNKFKSALYEPEYLRIYEP